MDPQTETFRTKDTFLEITSEILIQILVVGVTQSIITPRNLRKDQL